MSLAARPEHATAATDSLSVKLNRFLKMNYKKQLILLLLPYLLGLFVLVVLPALLSIPFALTRYDALSEPRWIGFRNFQEMAADPLFWNGVGASLFFIAIAVPLRLVGALLLAFLLHHQSRVNRFFRSMVYIPTIIPDVAYALLWLYIFNPLYGPLNWVLQLFGTNPNAWLLEPGPAKFSIIVMLLWPIGEGFVLMLAAFQDIPSELNEAAEVDGANGGQRFWRITLPMLAPAILLLLFRDTVLSFQINFVPALVMTHAGPYHATRYLPIYIWQNATEYQRFGYAAAMTWVMYAITAVVIIMQFMVAKRWRNAHFD